MRNLIHFIGGFKFLNIIIKSEELLKTEILDLEKNFVCDTFDLREHPANSIVFKSDV